MLWRKRSRTWPLSGWVLGPGRREEEEDCKEPRPETGIRDEGAELVWGRGTSAVGLWVGGAGRRCGRVQGALGSTALELSGAGGGVQLGEPRAELGPGAPAAEGGEMRQEVVEQGERVGREQIPGIARAGEGAWAPLLAGC